MVDHPTVRRINFIGSTHVGRILQGARPSSLSLVCWSSGARRRWLLWRMRISEVRILPACPCCVRSQYRLRRRDRVRSRPMSRADSIRPSSACQKVSPSSRRTFPMLRGIRRQSRSMMSRSRVSAGLHARASSVGQLGNCWVCRNDLGDILPTKGKIAISLKLFILIARAWRLPRTLPPSWYWARF